MNKTPQELAEQYAEQDEVAIPAINHDAEHLVKVAFVEGYKAATSQWVSVKDRLPEGYDLTEDDFKPYVLVRDCRHGIHVAAYEHCLKEFRTSATCSAYEESLYCVTHWMPLPQPPEEEDDE